MPTLREIAKAIREGGFCVSIAGELPPTTRAFAQEPSADAYSLDVGSTVVTVIELRESRKGLISVRLEDVTVMGWSRAAGTVSCYRNSGSPG
jgi:hypothetical protein